MKRMFILALVTGCVSTDGLDSLSVNEENLYYGSSLWGKQTIGVCFEESAFGTSTVREWMRQAVDATWGSAESAVNFSWYTSTPCSQINALFRDIRVTLDPSCEGFSSSGEGPAGTDDVVGGVIIKYCAQTLNRTPIQAAAVAEIGHALGFKHEQRRPDANTCTTDSEYHAGGGTAIGPYDAEAVENYCSSNGQIGRLSGTDIWGVDMLYGSAFPFSVVTTGSGKLEFFMRQVSTRSVAVRTYDSTQLPTWGAIASLPLASGSATSAPAAVAWTLNGQNRVDVFVRTESGSLAQNTKVNGTWSGWADLGGYIVGQPNVVVRGSGQLTVAARNSSYGLSVREFNGTQWLAWKSLLIGEFVGRPGLVATSDGAVHVFVNNTTDHSLRTMRSAAVDSWPMFGTNLGGINWGSPTPVQMVSASPADLWVFTRNANNAISYRRNISNTGWLGWDNLTMPAGGIAATPSVQSRVINAIEVYARDWWGNVIYNWVSPNPPYAGTWSTLYNGSYGGAAYTASAPQLVWSNANDVRIFSLGELYDEVQERWWNGSNWGISESPWATVGTPHFGTAVY